MENEFKTIIRDDIEVSAELQKLWAAELDLLDRFIEVCKKHGLKFYAAGGTLLGAIRHKGFIPWDDDIDLVMLREDYDKLLEVASGEFSEPYFFQTAFTDKGYFRSHAQLRNSSTTAMIKNEALKVPFNQGIFIDIFPIDAIPDNPILAEKQRKKLHSINRLLNNDARLPIVHNSSLFSKMKRLAAKIISVFYPHKKQFLKMERLCKMYNSEKTARLGVISFDPNDERMRYSREVFESEVEVTFEGRILPAPKGYDEILTALYGDYMTPKKAQSFHGTLIVDTQTPYKDCIKKMRYEQKQ